MAIPSTERGRAADEGELSLRLFEPQQGQLDWFQLGEELRRQPQFLWNLRQVQDERYGCGAPRRAGLSE
jgi:hypothetical protein